MDFLLELAQLIKETPRHTLPMQDCENCDYNSFLYKSKDCYLCYSSSFLETCLYLDTASYCKDSADGAYLTHAELCYECIDCDSCYNCNSCQDCKNCTDSDFCYDCQGCTNCFGCVGLRKKEFHIFNVKYSKEEYKERLKETKKMPSYEVREKIEKLRLSHPHPPMRTVNCENTTGDYVINSKNCYMCFNVETSEDCAYLYDEIYELRDCLDCTHIHACENCYGLMSAFKCYSVNFSWWMVNCRDSEFGVCNNGSNNCFGCVNIQRKEYCILNKPYSKEAYEKKVVEIKGDLKNRGLYGKYLLADAFALSQTI